MPKTADEEQHDEVVEPEGEKAVEVAFDDPLHAGRRTAMRRDGQANVREERARRGA